LSHKVQTDPIIPEGINRVKKI